MNKEKITASGCLGFLNTNDCNSSETDAPTSTSTANTSATTKSRSSSLSVSTESNHDSYSIYSRVKLINKITRETEKDPNNSVQRSLSKKYCEDLSEELLGYVEELAMLKVETTKAGKNEKDLEQEQQFRGRLKALFQLNNDLKRLTKLLH